MRKMKYVIGILLLFMVIGFATVTVSLSLSGNARLTGDIGDFKVYFSDVKMNDEQNLRLVKSETEIIFDVLLQEIGTTYKISYDVTNASSMFDANLSVSCTQGDEYVSVINDFDSSTLPALTTRTGDLTIKKLKAYGSETNKDYTITCSIVASPVERDSQASGEVISPIKPLELSIGDVISIAGENFNVISQTDTTVTMLAQYNLGTDYRQNSIPYAVSGTPSYVNMKSPGGWGSVSVATEIDLYTYSLDVVVYLDNYVNYLKEKTKISDITGTLITVKELGNLDCSIDVNYSSYDMTCDSSIYASWLISNQFWLTRSATVADSNDFWAVDNEGQIMSSDLGGRGGVRPVITVPIEIARKYYEYKWYDIGDEIAIEDEMFNVISDNGDTITMLAQYNLGTDYRQSEIENAVSFVDGGAFGWEYTPGPKEIDIHIWSTNPKVYINEYVTYLQNETGDLTLSGDLITLKQLKILSCDVPNDYSATSVNCSNVEYKEWLFNNQYVWTRSAVSDYSGGIWMIWPNGLYAADSLDVERGEGGGIRPIITISKDYL